MNVAPPSRDFGGKESQHEERNHGIVLWDNCHKESENGQKEDGERSDGIKVHYKNSCETAIILR